MARRRVAVAMSGGVDSSVAALRLVNQGEDVFGVMLRLWSAGPELENRCCSPRGVSNAKSIAAKLGIPFYVLDVKELFKEQVVDGFLDGYANGITPNPCIACNRNIRWGWLFERVLAMGATHMATGHYARVTSHGERFEIHRAVDPNKDQSYVLHVLTQKQLSKALFPIGDLRKDEVRAYAQEQQLTVAQRPDSQDLCFLGSMDYREFLRQQQLTLMQSGPIIDRSGDQIGVHAGLAAYTIGQRKGIGISADKPYYVLQKDVPRNTLIVGHREELGKETFRVGHVNWIEGTWPSQVEFLVQVRYKAKPVGARIKKRSSNEVEVHISEPLKDVTPGQWAVFYDGDICMGGGMILQ